MVLCGSGFHQSFGAVSLTWLLSSAVWSGHYKKIRSLERVPSLSILWSVWKVHWEQAGASLCCANFCSFNFVDIHVLLRRELELDLCYAVELLSFIAETNSCSICICSPSCRKSSLSFDLCFFRIVVSNLCVRLFIFIFIILFLLFLHGRRVSQIAFKSLCYLAEDCEQNADLIFNKDNFKRTFLNNIVKSFGFSFGEKTARCLGDDILKLMRFEICSRSPVQNSKSVDFWDM